GSPVAGAAAVGADYRCVVGLTGVADRPCRLEAATDEEIADMVAAIEPAVESERAGYRRQIAAVVVQRAVASARIRRAGGAVCPPRQNSSSPRGGPPWRSIRRHSAVRGPGSLPLG